MKITPMANNRVIIVIDDGMAIEVVDCGGQFGARITTYKNILDCQSSRGKFIQEVKLTAVSR